MSELLTNQRIWDLKYFIGNIELDIISINSLQPFFKATGFSKVLSPRNELKDEGI